MIKFEFNYDGSELISKGEATLLQVAQDICNKAGVELGSTSFLNSDKKISVYDNTVTAREYISYIAESAGCFACIDREGKLCFREFCKDEKEIPLELFGEYKWGEEFKISKVSYEDGVRSFKFGDNTRNNLWINQENMYIVDEDQVQKIYNKIKGLTVNTFEGKVIIDPAIDIGDKIVINGKNVIYQGEMSLEGRFIAQISSKIQIKQKEETTVKKESQKVVNRRVQSRIDQAEGKIEQLVEETTENSEKLTKHEQTIDSMKDTLKSQETKIETVDSKANKAQSTADTATTKANNAQTSADNAQTIANTANTNAQNAQKTANANTTKITTNTTKIAEVEKTVNGIKQSVGNVEEKVETVESTANTAKTTAENAQSTANTANTTANTAKSTADTAKKTADNTNDNLTTNYYTKTETNSQITQKAESITSEVSKTYSTKTETSNAKQEAIKSANSNTDDKLKGYTETSKLGTVIEQNYEHVKVAWNQISDFIQMMIINNNASLAILDKDKKVMMALDKIGQHFYKEDGTEFGEMGVNTIDNQNYISFGVSGEYDKEISDGMAWGITTKSDGKFWPILYLKNFSMGSKNSDSSSGELVLNNCNLVLDGLGTGIQTSDIKIYGDPAGRVLYFHGETDDKYFMQIISHGAYLSDMQLKYKNEMNILNDLIVTEYEDSKEIMIFDKIKFFRNVAGSNSLKIGDSNGNYCMLVDDGSISCSGNLMAGDYIHGSGDLYIENEISSKIINCWEHIYCNNGVESFSTLEKKKNIKKYEKSGLDEVLNTDIYYFNYKEDENNAKSRVGTIIGEGYNCSKDIISQTGESISDYSMISVAYKAIQEQQEQIEKLQAKDKQKDELIQSLIQRIETLEKEVNK